MSLFCANALAAEPPPAGGEADIAGLKNRLAEDFAGSPPDAAATDELLAGLDAQGNWPDLGPPGSDGKKRLDHFRRVERLATAYYHTTDAARGKILAAAIQRALTHWLAQEAPIAPNWARQIGVPKSLARTALLFEDQLSPLQLEQVLKILRTCVRPDGTLDYAGFTATGANLMDEVEIQVVANCLTGDAAAITRYVQMAEVEIKPGRPESIQVDWSFHQHGPQLYSGGYGAGLIRDATALAVALRGTPFAFSPESVDTLTQFLLQGFAFQSRGRNLDYLTTGRQIARPNLGNPSNGVRAALRSAAAIDSLHRSELESFADRLGGKADPGSTPAGNRLYWMSDYMTHQRPGFYASARMSSRRIQGYETGNDENERGYHLGDGAMALMVTGDEYQDIFPLWDWRHVPGVSNVVNPSVPFPRHMWGRGAQGFSDFAGGVSDGLVGVAAMELRRGGLQARKAWFFLPDSVVCLGNDILPDDTALPVVTTIDQRWADGPVIVNSSPDPLAKGETHAFTSPEWIHHAGVTFLFPDGGDVKVRTETRAAPWAAIRTPQSTPPGAATADGGKLVEGDVFMLWFDHGSNLHRGQTYAYIIAPGLAPAAIEKFRETAPRIVANTPALQAITAPDLLQCVFYQPGSLSLPDGRRITVDQPSVVQITRLPGSSAWTLSAGNPTQTVRQLVVKLERPGQQAADFKLDFPPGPTAGQSQTRDLADW